MGRWGGVSGREAVLDGFGLEGRECFPSFAYFTRYRNRTDSSPHLDGLQATIAFPEGKTSHE